MLHTEWSIDGHLEDSRDQNVITTIMKETAHRAFLSDCPQPDAARVAAVGQQSIPTRSTDSQLCPALVPGSDSLTQCPMSLFALMCPQELSDEAFVTCMSLCLGVPVPYTRLLQRMPDYDHIDEWADFLLNDAAHASRSRHTSHSRLAYCLSNLASNAGLKSSAMPSDVPVAEDDTLRRGDIVTVVAGISRGSSSQRFSSQTLLVTDVTLVHPFNAAHVFKPNSLSDAENHKNRSYRSAYNDKGMAFAPLACNTFGQQAPELLRYQWIIAEKAAQRVLSLAPGSTSPTDQADDSTLSPPHDSPMATLTRLRQQIFRNSWQEVLVAIFEGVSERVCGRTFALEAYPQYHDFFKHHSAPWAPPASLFSSRSQSSPAPSSPSHRLSTPLPSAPPQHSPLPPLRALSPRLASPLPGVSSPSSRGRGAARRGRGTPRRGRGVSASLGGRLQVAAGR